MSRSRISDHQDDLYKLAGDILRQTKGTCAMHTGASVRKLFWDISMTEEEIWDHFRQAGGSEDTQDRGGAINGKELVMYMEKQGWISEWEYIRFNITPHLKLSARASHKAAQAKGKMMDALQSPNKTVLGGFPIFDDGNDVKLDLDENNVLIPHKGERMKGYHMMHVLSRIPGIVQDYGFLAAVKNSWGSRFGDRGLCYLPIKHAEYIMREAWIVTK